MAKVVCRVRWPGMAAATDSKIRLKQNNKHGSIGGGGSCYCSICGKKLKFDKISDNSLTCWYCMIINASS
jgi:hypothetical protein